MSLYFLHERLSFIDNHRYVLSGISHIRGKGTIRTWKKVEYTELAQICGTSESAVWQMHHSPQYQVLSNLVLSCTVWIAVIHENIHLSSLY